MDMKLDGRVVFVTGGSRGIGREIALAFAREGARVAISYSENATAAATTVAALEAVGTEVIAVPLTLSDGPSIDRAVGDVLDRWGALDVLVANAVEWPYRASGPLGSIAATDWEASLAANLLGTVATMRASLPALSRARGRAVLISSDVARKGLPGATAYATAKAGLSGFLAAIKWEAGAAGVLVNIVAPGFTIAESKRGVDGPHGVLDRATLASDVAPAVVYLGSFANTRITGAVLPVDGGEGPA